MKRVIAFMLGVLLMFGLFGCGKHRYQLTLDAYGLQSKKHSYAAGEKVRVTYNMIATDTDYTFVADCEDVTLHTSYDDRYGFVIEFSMPEHDVTIDVESYNSMVHMIEAQFTVTNELADADIWILPDTEENRKTTVWGEAMIAASTVGSSASVTVDLSEEGLYLIRVIGTDGMYYTADAVALEDGQTILLQPGDGPMSAVASVYDADGTLVTEYQMFVAKL